MNRISSGRVILAVAMALIGVTCIARADDDERTCSVATLRGSYLFAASGYNIVGGVAQPKAVVEQPAAHDVHRLVTWRDMT